MVETESKTTRMILALSVMICSAGYAYRFLCFSSRSFSQFYVEWGFSEGFAQAVESACVASLILACVAAPVHKLRWLLVPGMLALVLETLCLSLDGGKSMPWLSWSNHALRISPFIILVCTPTATWVVRILKVATVLTFAGHGIKAIAANPIYIDYILVFLRRLHFDPTEHLAATALVVIGTIDLVLAHHLLVFKSHRIRWVLVYMMLWGAITAFSRVVYAGFDGWHEVAIRGSHFLVPYLLCRIVSGTPAVRNEAAG